MAELDRRTSPNIVVVERSGGGRIIAAASVVVALVAVLAYLGLLPF